jgi:chromate transport protein ChrA
MLPSALLALGVAVAFAALAAHPAAVPVLGGLLAASAGVLAASTYRLARAAVGDDYTLAIAALAFVAAWLGLHAFIVVALAGLLGVWLFRPRPPRPAPPAQPDADPPDQRTNRTERRYDP